MVIPAHNRRSVSAITKGLTATHWKITSQEVYCPDICDSIADSCTIITAIHTSCASTVNPIELKTPPPTPSWLLSSLLWGPFNRPKHSVCLSCYDSCFNKDNSPKMVITGPCPALELGCPSVCIFYPLQPDDSNSSILAGSSILSHDNLCPPIKSCTNQNLF
jgi:hypothetical protein